MIHIIGILIAAVLGIGFNDWTLAAFLLTFTGLFTWRMDRSTIKWFIKENDRLRLHIESLKNTGKEVLIIEEKSILDDRVTMDDKFYLDSDNNGVFWLMRNATKWSVGNDSHIALSIVEKLNYIKGYVHLMVTDRGLEYSKAGDDGWKMLLNNHMRLAPKGENSDN